MQPGPDLPNSVEGEPEPAGGKEPGRWEPVEIKSTRGTGNLTAYLPAP